MIVAKALQTLNWDAWEANESKVKWLLLLRERFSVRKVKKNRTIYDWWREEGKTENVVFLSLGRSVLFFSFSVTKLVIDDSYDSASHFVLVDYSSD
jgi:hypothetical protein